MKRLLRDFISYENRDYPFKVGRTIASSLTGFVVGIVAANIVWTTTVKYIFTIL